MFTILKRVIKRILPFNREYIDCCFEKDAEKYKRFSGVKENSLHVIETQIRVITHTIEKALSLSNCRDDFGKKKVIELIRLLRKYENISMFDEYTVDWAKSVISVYADYRMRHQMDIDFIPEKLRRLKQFGKGGAMTMKSLKEDFISFPEISKARHSIRNYSSEPISRMDIERAVSIAQTAPSACNRQATKVYAITDSHKISAIQEWHGGIRNFGSPTVIFAITQDLCQYLNEYERNTWLVDGGIFCMNFLYALNSVGIFNCPAIWGGMEGEDKFMEQLVGIPENERIVILVVGGYLPKEAVKTPCSPKRPLKDILYIV